MKHEMKSNILTTNRGVYFTYKQRMLENAGYVKVQFVEEIVAVCD